ncbi:PREDICTED: uncharacterized protein LOC109237009 [Nicotiana attenuata]|uniref:Uncharacterized protein n=1 Tax=Nicotiana attenuata TaxID=49451 RepID=A0A314LEU8_NICAT|nr:PREDICTED: uncharacterized protein LOC109237009 [Nicotiana attenuata]OIT40261.1 hypothetical protein A4A49_06070 [Nicotiana attenuata]
MVEALGPAKFYGSNLPRPRFYKPNEERVDPPVSVIDPLMSWAEEAHWSMGGVNFMRHRLQGRIEGNIEKLRSELEKVEKKTGKETPAKCLTPFPGSPLPPPAPYVLKRKRFLIDESELKERVGRKLGDEFDRVAEKSELKSGGAVEAVARRTRSRRSEDAAEVVNQVKSKAEKLKEGLKDDEKVGSSTRISPRLLKRRSP